jgi:hypothetical protein
VIQIKIFPLWYFPELISYLEVCHLTPNIGGLPESPLIGFLISLQAETIKHMKH